MSCQRSTLTESPNHWWAISWATVTSEGRRGVDRAGLGLERVADRRRAVDDRPGLPERIRAEQPREEAGDPLDPPQRSLRRPRLARVDRDQRLEPVEALALDPELADGRRSPDSAAIGCVGGPATRSRGDRGAGARPAPRWRSPRPGVGTVIAKSKVALSVGWSLQGNQVGEPCGSPATKAPSSVGNPARDRAVGVAKRLRPAAVGDHDLEPGPRGDRGRGRHHQLLPGAPERRRLAVDGHRAHARPPIVEVEGAQLLGRGGRDRRGRVELAVAGLVVELERVVADVVAAVALRRGRTGRRRCRRRGRGRSPSRRRRRARSTRPRPPAPDGGGELCGSLPRSSPYPAPIAAKRS